MRDRDNVGSPNLKGWNTSMQHADVGHVAVLDGWRALSILFVLVGHWVPLPRAWQANATIAASGMALFFVLSGFLITRLLLKDPRPGPFLTRRIFRILPLSWLAMVILVTWNTPDFSTVRANFLFYANLPPAHLMRGGHHLWSLCVEVQFYFFCAIIAAIFGRRAVFLLPVLGIAVTLARVIAGEPISIVTWHRVDEILAGASVAILLSGNAAAYLRPKVPAYACLGMLALLLASAHPEAGPLQYLRPYFSAATVALSILALPRWLDRILTCRPARYIAEISYALYVYHGMLTATVLGGEDAPKKVRYALRIPLVVVTFILAHVSTRFFEKPFTDLGKRIAGLSKKAIASPVTRA